MSLTGLQYVMRRGCSFLHEVLSEGELRKKSLYRSDIRLGILLTTIYRQGRSRPLRAIIGSPGISKVVVVLGLRTEDTGTDRGPWTQEVVRRE